MNIATPEVVNNTWDSKEQHATWRGIILAAYKIIGRCFPEEFTHNLDLLVELADEYGWDVSQLVRTGTGATWDGRECQAYYRFRHIQQELAAAKIIHSDGKNRGHWRLRPELVTVATIDIYREALK